MWTAASGLAAALGAVLGGFVFSALAGICRLREGDTSAGARSNPRLRIFSSEQILKRGLVSGDGRILSRVAPAPQHPAAADHDVAHEVGRAAEHQSVAGGVAAAAGEVGVLCVQD